MYHALIRTHHITSRKKVAKLKEATKRLNCYALLRSGGTPGVMYVEGKGLEPVQKWVDTVRGLRYKDYELVAPASRVLDNSRDETSVLGTMEEVDTVRDFASVMDKKGLFGWWRAGMGFSSGEEHQ